MSSEKFYNSNFLSEYKNSLSQKVVIEAVAPLIETDESDEDLKLEAVICAMNETLQEILESIKELGEPLVEGSVSLKARKIKDKVSNSVIKASLAEKSMSQSLNDKFNRFLQIFRDNRRTSSYDRVVKNTIDLSRTFKNLIGAVVTGLVIAVPGGIQVGAISAVIALLLKVAHDKRTNNKYKGMILNDLKFELRIVQEKLKDSDSRGDNKAKYKLLRIENQIARAIDRIKYNLRDYQA
jgi:hypothetical protein